MPPYYPHDLPNGYQNNYQYYAQYNQHPYNSASPQQPQNIPAFPQIQVNIPPHPLHTQPQSQRQPPQQFQPPSPQYIQTLNQQHYQYNQQPQYAQPYFPPPVQHRQQPPQAPPYFPQHQPMAPQQVQREQVPNHQTRPFQNAPNISRPQQPLQTGQQPVQLADEPDYAILLLTLADEYLEASTKISTRSDDYYKLTATALGCIQSVLTNYKLPPLREAQVSLKYAQILYNETENYDDAERILSKAVELCERMKFLDLKYGAQLLLAKVLHRTSPRAALKDLERMIEDIAAYRHVAWEYAFRLQYAMFSMTAGQASDVHAAIVQFEKLGSVAKRNGDNTVTALAAILEAFAHLRSSSPEAVEASQTALATARSMQLNAHVLGNFQIMLMMEFVDLCASLKAFNIAQSEQKRKVMQQVLYQAIDSKDGWRKDGLMYISLKPTSLKGVALQEGGLVVERNNMPFFAFQWLAQDEVEDLAYLLSGVSAAIKNAGDAGKAEKFFDEGLVLLHDIMDDKRPVNSNGELIHVRRQLIECHFLIERAFLQCSKGQWNKAEVTLNTVSATARTLGDQFPLDMECLVIYLEGSIAQGRGDLAKALDIYNSPQLQIQPQSIPSVQGRMPSQSPKKTEVMRDIAMLACMNTIFIIQNQTHPQHHRLQHLINTLDPLAQSSSNKSIKTTYSFVLASLPNNTILKTKQYLSNSLSAAQNICNAQITTLCLVTMQEKIFKGIVGGQAVKCARAATHQARRLNEPLWISVAAGLESECLSIQGGLNEDALRKKEEAERMKQMLPERVRIINAQG